MRRSRLFVVGAGGDHLIPGGALNVGEDLPTDISHPCTGGNRWPDSNLAQYEVQKTTLYALARKYLDELPDLLRIQPGIPHVDDIASGAELDQSDLRALPLGDLGGGVKRNRIAHDLRLRVGKTMCFHKLLRRIRAPDLESHIRIEPIR